MLQSILPSAPSFFIYESKRTVELAALSDDELQARFLDVRKYLNRNGAVPVRYRATMDARTSEIERKAVSESSRILHLARLRKLTLRYPTLAEIGKGMVFQVLNEGAIA